MGHQQAPRDYVFTQACCLAGIGAFKPCDKITLLPAQATFLVTIGVLVPQAATAQPVVRQQKKPHPQ